MNIDHESSMFVGVVKVELFFPHFHSLKDKRQALRKIKDKLFAKYKVSVHEVMHHDKWQRAQLGFAVVSNEGSNVHSFIDHMLTDIDLFGVGNRIDQIIEVFTF